MGSDTAPGRRAPSRLSFRHPCGGHGQDDAKFAIPLVFWQSRSPAVAWNDVGRPMSAGKR
jgi:hypothetical protein